VIFNYANAPEPSTRQSRGERMTLTLQMDPKLKVGHRYYVFFQLRLSEPDKPVTWPCLLELYVNSAYQREERVVVAHTFTFGRVADRTAHRRKF
jgi:hypothetical protein